MLKIEFGVAKVNKYASRESGDTVELVERPGGVGGFSAVLADGQGSGRAAKTLSNLVTSKAISLLKDGVRDGAVARATSDYLLAFRYGQVSATLNIISVDFVTRTLVITRNNPVPGYLFHRAVTPFVPDNETEVDAIAKFEVEVLDESSVSVGLYPRTRPVVREWPLEGQLVAVCFSDGIFNAGERYGERLDVALTLHKLLEADPDLAAQKLADTLLATAQSLDKQRPADDMSVLVVTAGPGETNSDLPVPRRLSLSATLP